MAQILIPFGPIVDDAGALVAGATIAVASVKDPLDDSDIAAHGATVVASADGLRVGVLYDVAAKGEAWITLAVSKAGSTITGVNQYPVAFAAADAQTIASRASQASVNSLDAAIAALPDPGQVYRILVTPFRSGLMDSVRYTRGAVGPDLLDHLVDGSGSRIDLTGWSVVAKFIRLGSESVIFNNQAASLGNAPEEGQVVLEWPTDSLDDPGQYRLIWTASKTGETDLTWYTLVVVE
jgi:hypothetical protein